MTDQTNFMKGRVEGKAKVTGRAKYSAEYHIEGLLTGVFVTSTIAAGRIVSLNTDSALASSGVVEVFSHLNSLPLENLGLFQSDEITYSGQPIALIVAESLEEAQFAANQLEVKYEATAFESDFFKTHSKTQLEEVGNERGSLKNWSEAAYIVDQEYTIATEVHSPMEMHATIAQWNGEDLLTLYDKSQNVGGVQGTMGWRLGIPAENIRVISEFVGGGFGSGLRVWYNTIAASLAAKVLNRPVKVVLTRPQMFSMVGHRPASWQRVKIGADEQGKLSGVLHQSRHATNISANHNDGITRVTRKIYGFENLKTEEALVPLNIPRPTWMRGPGDSSGCFAVESAIDELCYQMNADPVQIRLKNIAPYQMETGLPWSSHFLNECLERGAKKIRWEDRPNTPGALSENEWKIGYGMAVGLWNARRKRAGATAQLSKDGVLTIQSAMTDIGTGTGQAMLKIAHIETGMPKDQINIELGDSKFPEAPSQGGSWGLASVSGAIVVACDSLKKKLAAHAWPDKTFTNEELELLQLTNEGISLNGGTGQFVSYKDLFKNRELFTATEYAGPGAEREKYGFVSSAAHFYKVKVHTNTGRIKIDRMVIVVDAGKIINEKAAANQVIGAGVGGIGMALLEQQGFDSKTGRMLGNDLAGYLVAVNADAPIIEVSFIDKPDPHINPSGAKGLGEVGLIGSAAAIANAIYNATGVRIRDLPITPEKLLIS